ncbi:hypothetical protein H4219_000376 [Mycoemilia scoparia]|uniref:RING-type domain-containing protein n=1 Tax=Mycoemilia scoparia TaxID=417184 RepID=A0A9W8DX72_9FUNG|nr:hypothetical protein H4219_000376 [Mycoemilia scoparia]
MPRHSKNNTALGFFTYHERQQLNYGTKKQRLGTDSKRLFDSCYLCLQPARDPVCCPEGHLSCHECILENILTQKKDIEYKTKAYKAALAKLEKENKDKKEVAREVLRERLLKNERIPSSRRAENSIKSSSVEGQNDGDNELKDIKPSERLLLTYDPSNKDEEEEEESTTTISEGDRKAAIAQKRKAEEMAVMEELEKEAAEKDKPKLPSYWLPSLTPETKERLPEPPKARVVCTGGPQEHPLKLKHLISIKFKKQGGSDSDSQKSRGDKLCPACDKNFTNGTKIQFLKACGHAFCQNCVKRFVVGSKQCFVCQEKCHSKDIIEIVGEGTGFVGSGGQAIAQKFDHAFQ